MNKCAIPLLTLRPASIATLIRHRPIQIGEPTQSCLLIQMENVWGKKTEIETRIYRIQIVPSECL